MPTCAPPPAAWASGRARPGAGNERARRHGPPGAAPSRAPPVAALLPPPSFARPEDNAMIGRLKGILVHKQPPWLVVDVNGVGYELEAPMSTFYELPEVALFTHYAQKEDSVSQYGFPGEAERRMFRDVQKVTGIGAKIALAILSGASVNQFAALVQAGDITALTRIPGIGKKTAERIVVELRDRAAALAAGPPVAGGPGAAPPADPLAEATVALQQLGYRPAEARRMAKAAAADGDPAEDIIRKALQSARR